MKRNEYPKFHEDAYREAIVNAVIHRDYYGSGEVAVEKFSDIIVVNNPGGLVPSFPREEFGTLSWPRNRLLADLLSKTIYMEKAGTGIKRIREFCRENNNDVEIKPTDTHFFVKMYAPEQPKDGVKDGVKLTETQEKLLELVLENREITGKELAEEIGISRSGIEKNIVKLKEMGILTRIGPDKTGYWRVDGWTKDG